MRVNGCPSHWSLSMWLFSLSALVRWGGLSFPKYFLRNSEGWVPPSVLCPYGFLIVLYLLLFSKLCMLSLSVAPRYMWKVRIWGNPAGAFWFYAVVALAALIWGYFYVPETKGILWKRSRSIGAKVANHAF